MTKQYLQVWIMCTSAQNKMKFLLVEQTDSTEKKLFWGPLEIEITDNPPTSEAIPQLLHHACGIVLKNPILIPFKKNYEKEDSSQAMKEVYLVVGLKISSEKDLMIDQEKENLLKSRWMPLVEVLDYLHKEFHSIIFFDWYKAIQLHKLP